MKILLAVLLSGENDFLLIDEPTNHLDRQSRENVKEYLAAKRGFILVSHGRGLLVDLEHPVDLKIMPMEHHKERLVNIRDYSLRYQDAREPVFTGLTFTLERGERIAVHGENGCGKSTLLKMILKKAGAEDMELPIMESMDRVQFLKNMEDYSEGQKKKVLIAASLLVPAHLYIWDEPLNYIDVFSKMQIEKLLLTYQPTMLFVEHDVRFRETIATRTVEL